MPVRYRRLLFEIEPDDRERLTDVLWREGTLGIEEPEGGGRLIAYFRNGETDLRADWSASGARLIASEVCEDRDWMAAYRERSRPIEVGSRLLVDPREPGGAEDRLPGAPADGRRLLRLPARTAFGTGSHPSTSLVVDLLEELDVAGMRVLDVGAGSGILSFAALVFGAAEVVGVEIDAAAALVAGQNRALNALFPWFVAGGLGALSGPPFDLALVNVLPARIAGDLDKLGRRLRPAGMAIFSGILTEAMPAVRERLTATGFEPTGERACDEWSALSTVVGGR